MNIQLVSITADEKSDVNSTFFKFTVIIWHLSNDTDKYRIRLQL